MNPNIYKFIYHASLRSDYLGIILDGSKHCNNFIKETLLFKDIFYNIEISSMLDYENIDIACKDDTHKFHYFCEESKYNNLKGIPCLAVYLTSSQINEQRFFPVNYGETIKRLVKPFSSIEEYIRVNDYTLFLDTEGNVYDNIYFINKVCNIFNDNIEVKLFDYIRKRVSI